MSRLLMESSAYAYRSYLLRIWYSRDGLTWRAMLEEIGRQECRRFSNPEELVSFLKMQMVESSQGNDFSTQLDEIDEM